MKTTVGDINAQLKFLRNLICRPSVSAKLIGSTLRFTVNSSTTSVQILGLTQNNGGTGNYVHPEFHLPSIISQNSSNRFVTNAQISAWNEKQNAISLISMANWNTAYTESHIHSNKSLLDLLSNENITNWNSKQATLVSGTNIKTINGNSLLGSGDIIITGALTLGTQNGLSLSTQVLSLGLATTNSSGALSSTNWNTFNNKLNINGSAAALTNFPTLNQNTTGSAATVITNANLTGVVTSIGNATAIANNAITNAMLANGAVANLSNTNSGDNAVNTLYNSLVSNATHTGEVTGSTALTIADNAVIAAKIADNAVTNAKIAGSGTRDTTTFYRGDGTFAVPSGAVNFVDIGSPQSITGLKTFTATTTFSGQVIPASDGSGDLGISGRAWGNSCITTIFTENIRERSNTSSLKFQSANGTARGTMFSTGNWFLGPNPVDGGRRLEVSGTTHITGILTTDVDAAINTVNIGRGGGNVGSNIRIGANTLPVNTTGFSNSAIGGNALFSNTTGGNNSAIGASALLSNTTGNSNSAIGVHALNSNTTGSNNSAIGSSALFSNTTGFSNSAIGVNALNSNTTGGNNSAIGGNALFSNTTGSDNSAIGTSALFSNTTGFNNSAIGLNALNSNTTGGNNSAIGVHALNSNTTGSNNSAIGVNALDFNTTGGNNSAIGRGAGRFITGGVIANAITNNSIYVGFGSKALANDQTNQIVIGHDATGLGSNTTVLGNTNTVFTRLFGAVGIGTSVDNGNALGVVGNISSSQYRLSALNIAPASATATGTLGEIRVTAGFIFVCIATDTWVSSALSTW